MATLLQNSSRGPAVLHYQYCYLLCLIHTTWALLSQWLLYHCITSWWWRLSLISNEFIIMLTRMLMGLFLSLLQVIVYIIVAVNHDATYWQHHHSLPRPHASPSFNCYLISAENPHNHSYNTSYDDPIGSTYLHVAPVRQWPLLPICFKDSSGVHPCPGPPCTPLTRC